MDRKPTYEELEQRVKELEKEVRDCKRLEKTLRESEAKWRSTFENAPEIMLLVDRDGRIQAINRVPEGLRVEDTLGTSVYDYVEPEHIEKVRQSIAGVFSRGRPSYYEIWARGPHDTVSWYETRLSALKHDNQTRAVMLITRDTTTRKKMKEALRESEERFHVLFSSGNDAVFVNHPTAEGTPSKFIEVNDVACQKYGYTRDELLNLTPLDLRAPDHVGDFEARVENVLAGRATLQETVHTTKDGKKIPVELLSNLFKLKDQTTVITIARDITDRKKTEGKIKASLREKEVLLSEIHHRVKNNMQVVSSLLKIQSDKIPEKEYADMFKESQDRIRSMALIHEKLYQSEDFANVDFNGYVKSLVNSLFRSYGIDTNKIALKIEIDDVSLGVDTAIPCGLLINELVSNSLKYAFPEERNGEISIALRSINEDEFELIVNDDGIGIPEDLDIKNTESFGMELISILAEDQLDGQIELDRTAGTRYQIRLKRQKYRPRI